MVANLYLGKTNVSVTDTLIEKLKENYGENKFSHHVFLVPDRVSVLTEIKIFESLKIESTMSIEVLTMSRLTSKILGNRDVISKNASCMLIQKIINENKGKLKCFNKTITPDLSNNIYELISQFKSCKINFDEVSVKNKDSILQDKLNDVALIYKTYQQYLQQNNLFDGMDKLDELIANIKQSEFINSSCFYVCNFDGFTYQGFQLIGEICKNCMQFNIGVLDSNNVVNEHIYNKDFLEKVKNVLTLSSGVPNIIYCKDVEKGSFAHLRDNLFGFNLVQKKLEDDSICLFEGENFEQEVLFCASNIKNLIITKKYKYNNFVVVVPNLQENYTTIERIFGDYNFSFYLDITTEFEKSVLIKYIKSLFDLIEENYSKTSVLSLVKNPLFNIERSKIECFEDVLNKYNIRNYYDLKNFKLKVEDDNFNEVRSSLFEKTEEFKTFTMGKNNTYTSYVEALQRFLNICNVFDILQQQTNTFANSNETKLAKLYEQYYGCITEVFEQIQNVLKNETCDFNLFVSTFLAGVKGVNLSTSPISTNAIFVGDSVSSFFDRSKVYFILNIQEDLFPKVFSDFGLISDKEIEQLNDCYLLEPSIKEINFKQRFKAFDTLLKPEDKLFLSCNYSSPKFLKGKIIEDVSKLFSKVNDKNGFNPLEFLKVDTQNNFILNNDYKVAYNEFVKNFRAYINGQSKNDRELAMLYNALNLKKEDLNKFYFKNDIKISNNLFLLNNKISVSEVESFMSCPFLHFCNYGLKLQHKLNADITPLNVGSILHAVAELVLSKNNFPVRDDDVKDIAIKAFENVMQEEVFENIKANSENKILIKNLEKEAIRLCYALNFYAKNSKFKPTYFEESFGGNSKIKGIDFNVENKKIKLTGKIDRVDIYDKYFRIIDYKTGECNRNLKELYFGKKVQLDAYLMAVQKGLNLTPVGAYYFPIKGGFDKDENEGEKYKLKGETLRDLNVVLASDARFEDETVTDSNLIEVKFNKKKDGRGELAKSKTVSLDEINERGDYALKLIEKSCADILKLNITPSPLVLGSKDKCESCEYFGFCRFSESFGNHKRKPQVDVSKSNFNVLKGEEDGQI